MNTPRTPFLKITLALAAMLPLTGHAQQVPLKVNTLQQEIPIANITSVGGFAGDRIRKNKDNYLKTFPIDEHVAFIETRTYKDWDWRKAEQPGKWVESSILTAMRTEDKELDEKVHAMFDRLIKSQEPEGYIGPTSRDIRTPEKPMRGMDAYELYFLHHALLTAYEQWHDDRGLTAAKKLGDYFVKYIGPGKAEFWPSKERYPDNVGKVYRGTVHSDLAGHSLHYSWEGSLLIDPMLRLYELTGDKRYYDWCTWVIGSIDRWSGWNAYSNLDKVADGTMPINAIQPYVHSHTFQMNFLGFLRMYQITGDSSYLRKVTGAWNDIAKRQLYITGGVGVGEHYERDYVMPLTGKMVETCANMSWMQLSQQLLELTGDTKYADAMERLLWNHVFAAQAVDGDCSRYNTPPNGTKPDGYFREPDCCTASGHRLMSLLPEFIYTTGNDGVYINQFVTSNAMATLPSGRKVTIKTESGFPVTSDVTITLTPEKKDEFTAFIRIPAWCKTPGVSVNGKALQGVIAGRYLAIKRRWKAGDKITVQLPMTLAWVRRQHHINASDRKPYKTAEELNAPYALTRGPIVYAFDNTWYDGQLTDFKDKTLGDIRFVLDDAPTLAQVKTPRADMLGPGYRVTIQFSNGRRTSLPMYPFANIGVWYKDASNKPAQESETYAYAVYLKGVPADARHNDKLWSVRMAKSEMARYPVAWQYEGKTPRWGYHQGVTFKALLDMWQYTEDPQYYTYAHLYGDSVIARNGTIKTYSMDAYNIDMINAGKILFTLYNQTKDSKYSVALQTLRAQMRKQPRTSEGGFWHKKRYPNQMWLDGLYMGAPFLAQYARDFEENALFDEVVNQIKLVAKRTYDPRTGLYYHAWDESRKEKWANKETGQSPNFWARSIGWYAMALVDVLDYLPDDHPGRKDVIRIIEQVAAGIVEYQEDRSGSWYQVVDQGGREGNYLESSGSSMFVYFLYKAIRRGYLPERYRVAADKGYAGLLKNFIREDANGQISLTKVCAVAGLGGDPYRDGSYEYYISEPIRDNDPKGVGPFIWASIEHELTQNSTQP